MMELLNRAEKYASGKANVAIDKVVAIYKGEKI